MTVSVVDRSEKAAGPRAGGPSPEVGFPLMS